MWRQTLFCLDLALSPNYSKQPNAIREVSEHLKMPSYRYVASDASGTRREGTIEAESRDEAATLLSGGGLRVLGLIESSGRGTVQAGGDAPVAANPRLVPLAATDRGRVAAIQRGADVGARRTRWGTDRERSILFTQVASYLRSGINPAESFARIGQNWRRPGFSLSFEAVSRAATEGARVSDVLERFPYLYPPHVVGLFRAGEQSGFLPEACDVIAKQAEDSARFRRLFGWIAFLAVSGILGAAPAILAVRSSLESIRQQDAAGGQLPGLATLMRAFGSQVAGPPGWISLGVLVSGFILLRWFLGMPMRRARHRAILLLPTMGKRARFEAMALFAWAVSMLSRAALAPKSALLGAAAAMPNLHLAAEMERVGAAMSDRDKLSEALRDSRLVPPEFAPLVATGEVTGDVPGQVQLVARSARDEFESVDRFAKRRVGCWVALLFALGFLFSAWLLYGVFYPNLMDSILSE